MANLSFKVSQDFSGSVRLDQYVANVSPDMNRSKLKSGVQSLLLNGKKSKLSAKVKANDIIDIVWEDDIPENIEPENIPLNIIFENENVTVVNKAQGMVTHPAAGNWSGTLVNALLYHWGRESVPQLKDRSENEILKFRRPGIVHRLDKDTSGLIITARNRSTEEWLGKQFKDRLTQKEYICICTGRPPAGAGDVKTQIIRDPKNRQRFKAATDTTEGKFARSIYHVIAQYGSYSIIRVRIKTGRTHQIRVHMKYLGCPILGDPIYGHEDKLFPKATLMLHSRQMLIRPTKNDPYFRFRAKIPRRFYDVLKKLKENFPKEVPNWVSNKKKLK